MHPLAHRVTFLQSNAILADSVWEVCIWLLPLLGVSRRCQLLQYAVDMAEALLLL